MRFLRGTLAAALLLGCNDESSSPTQPASADRPADAEISAGVAEATTTSASAAIRGFFVGNNPTASAINIGTGFTVIQKISLPAGSYVATAMAVLASNDPEARLVDCMLAVGGVRRGQLARGMVGGLGANNFTTIPNTIVFAIKVRTNLTVVCQADLANRVVSQPSPLTAIRVDSVTVQRE